jgi:hypothetical protein
MITFTKNYAFTLTTAQNQYSFVKASRDCLATGAIYTVQTIDDTQPVMNMIGYPLYQQLLAGLDPTLSLPVLINNLYFPIEVTSLRIEEFYHIVCGISEFPGSDPNPVLLNKSGLELKVRNEGQGNFNVAEAKTSTGSQVTATYPILSGSVSAYFNGGPLTVGSISDADALLGLVPVENGASPLSDGTIVQLAYDTVRYCVVYLTDDRDEQPDAVLVSDQFLAYMQANQVS